MSEAQLEFRATRSIESWLARTQLTLDLLQRLPTNTQAQVGRQWKLYQQDVDKLQKGLGLNDQGLELYGLQSSYSAPNLENLDVARQLNKYRTFT